MFSKIGILVSFLAAGSALGDWPQWRGPLRNGIQPEPVKLTDYITKTGLKELWESEAIPSNDDGGFSSPVAAGGKVFLSVVWQRDLPSEKRQIDDLVLRQLGFNGSEELSDEFVAEMERTRLSIPPTLRGVKLDEFTARWIEEHLESPKLREIYGGMIAARFKQGESAFPFTIFQALWAHRKHVFANDAEMHEWVNAQGWSARITEQIFAAVPATIRTAEDALVCLDLASGKTLWKAALAGTPLGRRASATPCVVGGKVFAVGSTRAWYVDAQMGKVLWEAPLQNVEAIGSSPLVFDGTMFINADAFIALDAATGAARWRQEKVGGSNSSPVAWSAAGVTLLIVNGRTELFALDPRTGDIAWSAPGGGACTPGIAGDILATQAKGELGLVAYRITPRGATKLWSRPTTSLRRESSPIIYQNAVYLMDQSRQSCLDLTTGAEHWSEAAPCEITSPILADGKLFTLTGSASTLTVVWATPKACTALRKARVDAQWVPSPCICDGRLILRMKNSVKCWSLLP